MHKRTLALLAAFLLCGVFTAIRLDANNKELTRKLNEETQKASQLEHQLKEEQKRSEDIQNNLDSLQQELQNLKEQNTMLQQDNEKLQKELAERPVVEKTLYMTGTGYTAYDAGMNGLGHTRSGTNCKQGRTISVDPSVIPLGTKVQITSESYPQINGVYVAEDTGSAIKGNIIDIYFDTKKAAHDFGRRKDLVVKVLRT
jgi:3D (Asp-Asp-Asp) domain-containing protein